MKEARGSREALVRVRPMIADDGDAVLAIYGEGIASGDATFETSVPTWATWDAGHLAEHRLVAVRGGVPDGEVADGGAADDGVDDGAVLGWAACSPVSERCVYAGVAEVSVYVGATGRGRGVGGALLAALVSSTEAAGIWTLQAGVFTDNAASLAMLARGFRRVGVRERLGQRDGIWRDVVLLERRSST